MAKTFEQECAEGRLSSTRTAALKCGRRRTAITRDMTYEERLAMQRLAGL